MSSFKVFLSIKRSLNIYRVEYISSMRFYIQTGNKIDTTYLHSELCKMINDSKDKILNSTYIRSTIYDMYVEFMDSLMYDIQIVLNNSINYFMNDVCIVDNIISTLNIITDNYKKYKDIDIGEYLKEVDKHINKFIESTKVDNQISNDTCIPKMTNNSPLHHEEMLGGLKIKFVKPRVDPVEKDEVKKMGILEIFCQIDTALYRYRKDYISSLEYSIKNDDKFDTTMLQLELVGKIRDCMDELHSFSYAEDMLNDMYLEFIDDLNRDIQLVLEKSINLIINNNESNTSFTNILNILTNKYKKCNRGNIHEYIKEIDSHINEFINQNKKLNADISEMVNNDCITEIPITKEEYDIKKVEELFKRFKDICPVPKITAASNYEIYSYYEKHVKRLRNMMYGEVCEQIVFDDIYSLINICKYIIQNIIKDNSNTNLKTITVDLQNVYQSIYEYFNKRVNDMLEQKGELIYDDHNLYNTLIELKKVINDKKNIISEDYILDLLENLIHMNISIYRYLYLNDFIDISERTRDFVDDKLQNLIKLIILYIIDKGDVKDIKSYIIDHSDLFEFSEYTEYIDLVELIDNIPLYKLSSIIPRIVVYNIYDIEKNHKDSIKDIFDKIFNDNIINLDISEFYPKSPYYNLPEKTIFCIVGESGSGKDTIVNNFIALHPEYKVVTSYTDRPIRPSEVEGREHYFVSPDKFNDILDTRTDDIVAYTQIGENGYRYCALTDDLDKSDIYIIDPKGIEYLKDNFEYRYNIVIIYIDASYTTRKNRVLSRGDDLETFVTRQNNESSMFREFRREREYNYIIDNGIDDDINSAVERLNYIINKNK